MVNYGKGLIYKLECKDPEITDIYVGSTCNFNRRKQQHKQNCTAENSRGYNIPVYQYIRQNGGWNNWQMILVEYVSCRDKKELNRIEAKYIKELDAKLNRIIPGRTNKEYYEEKKEIIAEKAKKYYEEKKEIIKEKVKKYYEEKKEIIAEKVKKYREEKKEIIDEYQKKYYEEKKEILAEKRKQKIECPCGSVVVKRSLARHIRSIKHQKWEQEQK